MTTELLSTTARLQTEMFTIELAVSRTETPCNLTHVERNLVIVMQRQRLQTFSKGRFQVPGAPTEFIDIGRLLALPPDCALEISAEGGVTESVRCTVSAEALRQLIERERLIDAADLGLCLNIKCPRIAQMLAQLASEVERPGQKARTLVDALGTAIVIELSRYLESRRCPGGLNRGGLARRAFRQVVDHVNQCDGDTSITALADRTGYSERHLGRAFKESTGQTLHQYISEVRLKRAIELLYDPGLMIKDIAKRLGFSSAGSFCAAFARQTGESPGEFRKRQMAISDASVSMLRSSAHPRLH